MSLASGKIAVIGAGNVGATAAYALMLRGLFSDIVLIDSDAGRAHAETLDIADANAMARPARIRSGHFPDAADADIVVLTAGAAAHGEESRISVAGRSAAIVAQCVEQIMVAGFSGLIVVACNPVDVMTEIARKVSGLPAERIIGTGTLLDSSRFRRRIADHLDVAPASVEALVLGEHGDSEVVAFSTVRIGGMPLDQFPGGSVMDRAAIARDVMRAGYEIIQGKGYTSFGVATAIVRICEAIRRDERVVLPVSARAAGQYGIEGLYLSLPCIVGAAGVIQIVAPDLSPAETEALQVSAQVIRQALRSLRHPDG
jgi:L-lactate dehydrogenase